MLVERIHKYLREPGDKPVNEAVLEWATQRLRYALERQFVKDRSSRPGWMYATLVTQSCVRKSAYKYHLVTEDEPLPPRAKINFFAGDLIEIAVLTLAKIAGCDISTPFEFLPKDERLKASEGGTVLGSWSDGITQAGGTWLNVEVKKLSDFAFDEYERKKGPDDAWGYCSQMSIEVLAWNQLFERLQMDVRLRGTLLLGVRGLTGKLAEWVVPYDARLTAAAFSRARAVMASAPDSPPDRAYALVEVAKGPNTGRKKLPTACAYCSYKKRCWPGVTVEFERKKPVFYVDEIVQQALVDDAFGREETSGVD